MTENDGRILDKLCSRTETAEDRSSQTRLQIRKPESGEKGEIALLGIGQLFLLVRFRESVNSHLSLASVESGAGMRTFERVHIADVCMYVCVRIYV